MRIVNLDTASGMDHGFDENAKPGEPEFEKVKAALEFLKKHVE